MSQDPAQAEQLIRELGSLTDRTRTAGRSLVTGLPLIGWGVAFGAGYTALDLLDGVARLLVLALAWVIGMLCSWLPMRHAIRTGAEGRTRWGWVVVLVASPFLVAAAQPSSWVYIALFLGALWGMAMSLYAVATADVPFAVAGMIVVVVAAVSAVQPLVPELVCFGIGSALPLLIVGVYRTVRGARHV
ncbi:hypothetical protein [Ruania zhangjianzhongii]|uniref:hypothetical protein n=1 Tax=Ruania zhangjianzhongii TaxID=2603206 RepID=UPI0011CC8748|nr:hypothetical protein [Ruania zhangjianzhongii]